MLARDADSVYSVMSLDVMPQLRRGSHEALLGAESIRQLGAFPTQSPLILF
jgi:hypothetical protein